MTPSVEEPFATGGWPFLAMTSKQQVLRAKLLLLFLVAAFAVLAGRLVYLQVLKHGELSARAEQNTEHEYWQAPRRGDILDANGNILATSITVKTVYADPLPAGQSNWQLPAGGGPRRGAAAESE